MEHLPKEQNKTDTRSFTHKSLQRDF